MPAGSRRTRHKHQPTLYLLENSRINVISSFPVPALRENMTYLPNLNQMADLFNPMKSMKRKTIAALSSISSRNSKKPTSRPVLNGFSAITVNANISPRRPQLSNLQIPLQLVPPRVSSLQDKPMSPLPTTPEIFEHIRMEHFKDLLSGLNSRQETQLFNALVRLKAEILQQPESPKDAPNHRLPLPRRREATFTQAYAAASFDSPTASFRDSITTASSESYIRNTILSSLPEFGSPTSKIPILGLPLSNIPTTNSPQAASSIYSFLSQDLSAATSVHSSQFPRSQPTSPSQFSAVTDSIHNPKCECTNNCIRNSIGQILETQKICDYCLQWVHRRGSLNRTSFKFHPLPTPYYATHKFKPILSQTPNTITDIPTTEVPHSCDFDIVYTFLHDFEYIESRLQHCDESEVKRLAEERLEELFDMICHRSTTEGFVNVGEDDGFEAVTLYAKMYDMQVELNGQPEGGLKMEAQGLVREMHARISELLGLRGCDGR